MLTTDAALAEAVRNDPNGIGYASMTMAKSDGLKVASINNVEPSVTTVNEGYYPYARQLRLYTITQRETRMAAKFIRFVRSKTGQKILEDMGFVRRFEPRLIEDSTSP